MERARQWWTARVERLREIIAVASLLRYGGWLTVASVGLSAVSSLMPIALTLSIGNLVGSAAAVASGHPRTDPLGTLTGALALMAAVFLLQQVLNLVSGPVSTMLSRRIDGYLRDRVRAAMLRPRGVPHLDDPRIQDDIMKSLYGGGGVSVSAGALGVTSLVAGYVTVAGTFIMVASFSPLLAVAILLVALVIRRRLSRENADVFDKVLEGIPAGRRASYTRQLLGEPEAAKEVRLFKLPGWLLDRYERDRGLFDRGPWPAENRLMFRSMGYDVVASALFAVSLFLIIAAALKQDMTIAALSIYVRACGDLIGLAEPPAESLHLSQAVKLMQGFKDIDQATATVAEVPWGDGSPLGMPARSVRFENLTFTYPRSEVAVFRGLNLELDAGRSHAIVGINGAGKTTLIKLLTGMYEPDGGRILVDEVPLRDLDPAAWRRRIAVIFQDFTKYPLSFRDNVGFGALDHIGDQSALERAVSRAGATVVLEELPEGWDAILTRQLEGGEQLSGGQWQRIALARALFAVESGASVLVLDEPTANLDVRAEAEMFSRFLELTAGLTSLVISHRFSTVRRAQNILVLDQGRVVEQGSHDELLTLAGKYAEMFNLQRSRFVEEPPAAPPVADE